MKDEEGGGGEASKGSSTSISVFSSTQDFWFSDSSDLYSFAFPPILSLCIASVTNFGFVTLRWVS